VVRSWPASFRPLRSSAGFRQRDTGQAHDVAGRLGLWLGLWGASLASLLLQFPDQLSRFCDFVLDPQAAARLPAISRHAGSWPALVVWPHVRQLDARQADQIAGGLILAIVLLWLWRYVAHVAPAAVLGLAFDVSGQERKTV
jgi:hypothetical protein